MSDIVVTTFDWVPEGPRGYVRDLRVRWALEEAGLAYRVASVPIADRGAEHFRHQPFGQVPWLTDDGLSIFETGAILLHLGEKSAALMPQDGGGRADVISWLFGALNSVEMPVVPWTLYKFSGDEHETPGRTALDGFLAKRLTHMEAVLERREWLAGAFSVADIAMVDVLRLVDRFGELSGYPACEAYVARGIGRPAFIKAHGDQIAHFAAADAKRG
ncbi:glutathione S-transferase family protein [Pelagibacterium montanilacus]|uniref:glutathione S-transferase family protein n=1 Tax=Pelagibacterium montanilacus TaxID=2185280 RepID=UPI000F8F170E|nr:glutathione S-transferase family protein [Pelagibacterium montanilacus]